MPKPGSIFLIPTYLSEQNDAGFISTMVHDVVKNTSSFLVENVRTARRFISSLKLGIDISSLNFEVLDKKTTQQQLATIIKPIYDGKDIGVISEAGLPGLADPGGLAVAYAHRQNIRVVPLPGASAIQTAVTTSGFNGQQFIFHGYLPIQKADRIKAIKNLESDLTRTGYTQVFMETPFRNNSLLEDLTQNLNKQTYLHIAADIFGGKELVKTLTVGQWKNIKPDIHKLPSVFCIGQMS